MPSVHIVIYHNTTLFKRQGGIFIPEIRRGYIRNVHIIERKKHSFYNGRKSPMSRMKMLLKAVNKLQKHPLNLWSVYAKSAVRFITDAVVIQA